MNKILLSFFAVSLFFSQASYYGSTTAPVVLVGGVIKAKHVQPDQVKYKRKDCPVCKGKGWYMSGDGIKRVDCGYCEPEDGSKSANPNIECDGDSCKTKVIRK
jgi:ribosomal protein S27AE